MVVVVNERNRDQRISNDVLDVKKVWTNIPCAIVQFWK